MKRKKIYAIIACALVFVSCSKKNDPITPEKPDEEKLHKITLSVGGFTETNSPFEKYSSNGILASDPLINRLLYVILDKDKLPIDTVHKVATAGTNSADIYLLNGKYTLRILGYKTDPPQSRVDVAYKKYESAFTYSYSTTILGNKSYKVNDFFFLEQPLEVSKDMEYNDLKLKRFNSRLELNILDKIPTGIKYIEISTPAADYFYLGLSSNVEWITTPYESYFSNYIDVSGINNQSNQTISTNVLTTGQKYRALAERIVSVKINAYDTSDKLIVSKEVQNVKLIPNTITKLTGNLFEGLTNEKLNSFGVTIDENFSANTISQSF